jgi:hypothetical protein
VRDWAAKGNGGVHVLAAHEIRRRLRPATAEQTLAAVRFRLGQYLRAAGPGEAALRHFAGARRLHPESLSYKRQTSELEQPGKAGGPELWAAVDALGARPYYEPVEMEGMPP